MITQMSARRKQPKGQKQPVRFKTGKTAEIPQTAQPFWDFMPKNARQEKPYEAAMYGLPACFNAYEKTISAVF